MGQINWKPACINPRASCRNPSLTKMEPGLRSLTQRLWSQRVRCHLSLSGPPCLSAWVLGKEGVAENKNRNSYSVKLWGTWLQGSCALEPHRQQLTTDHHTVHEAATGEMGREGRPSAGPPCRGEGGPRGNRHLITPHETLLGSSSGGREDEGSLHYCY